jgi:hypothetical protein
MYAVVEVVKDEPSEVWVFPNQTTAVLHSLLLADEYTPDGEDLAEARKSLEELGYHRVGDWAVYVVLSHDRLKQ